MNRDNYKIPEATIQRLSIYLRCLECLEKGGQKIVSSHELAKNCGLKAAQIRKDFAYFGELGVRGVGYYINNLTADLKKILGLTSIWEVALVGAGHLGTALMAYQGFIEYGFSISAVFDINPDKVPANLRDEHEVYHISRLAEIIRKKKIKIAIIAVPATAGQDVADMLIEAGIKSILNFVPVKLIASDKVKIRSIDLAVELGVLTFFLSGRKNLK